MAAPNRVLQRTTTSVAAFPRLLAAKHVGRQAASNAMDNMQLSEYSRRFAAVLFAVHPEWREFASLHTTDCVDEGSLLVEIFPAQPRDIKGPLLISTDGDEITIGFDIYHSHFNRYADDEEAEAFAEALAFIADILAERIAIISWWDGDEWRGSSSITTGADVGTPSWARNAKTARIRSWRGTYDKDIAA